MTRIAKKKGVDNKAGYVVKPIAVKDIEKQADFGTFKITRTRDCIAYTNYVGYSVITKPYTTTPEGKATELSLYAWLNYALEQKEYLEQHKDEPLDPNDKFNCEFWLPSLVSADMQLCGEDYGVYSQDDFDNAGIDFSDVYIYLRKYNDIFKEHYNEPFGKTNIKGVAWLEYYNENEDILKKAYDARNEYEELQENNSEETFPQMLEARQKYLEYDKPFSGVMTCGKWLEQIKVITEANLTKPCVVFTDADYATEEAIRHTKWLTEKTKQLKAAMTQTPSEEDEKKNEEEFGRAVGDENLRNNLQLDNIEGD